MPKRILIVDDEPDITLTFKVGLDGYYYDKRRFEVYTYNNPTKALSEFKPHFYDLVLSKNMHLIKPAHVKANLLLL